MTSSSNFTFKIQFEGVRNGLACQKISEMVMPLAATFSQNKFSTDGLVMKFPPVVGPRHTATNGSITPICRVIGELVSLQVKS